jgi:hypothetical protein
LAFGATIYCRSESLERLIQRSYKNSRRSSFAGLPLKTRWILSIFIVG